MSDGRGKEKIKEERAEEKDKKKREYCKEERTKDGIGVEEGWRI